MLLAWMGESIWLLTISLGVERDKNQQSMISLRRALLFIAKFSSTKKTEGAVLSNPCITFQVNVDEHLTGC